jgi:hypothetical protein
MLPVQMQAGRNVKYIGRIIWTYQILNAHTLWVQQSRLRESIPKTDLYMCPKSLCTRKFVTGLFVIRQGRKQHKCLLIMGKNLATNGKEKDPSLFFVEKSLRCSL